MWIFCHALLYKVMLGRRAMKVLSHFVPYPMVLIYHFMLPAFCIIPLKLCNIFFILNSFAFTLIDKYPGSGQCLRWLTLQRGWGLSIFTREESWCLSATGVAAFSFLCSSWCPCLSPSVQNCERCLGQSCWVHVDNVSNEPKYWVLLVPVPFGSTHWINSNILLC